MPRVLHLLAQRPFLTGSGVTLDALVRHATSSGWTQRVLVGQPVEAGPPAVGGLPETSVAAVAFGAGGDLPFPVPGMSDLMPYESSRWACLDAEEVGAYAERWRRRISELAEAFRPDVVHSHHVWLLSALVKDVLPEVPLVVHCHATGLRQMALCPHLAEGVRDGCRRAERFVVLHRGHAAALCTALEVPAERVEVVGAGYEAETFHSRGRRPRPESLLFAGKLATAKGLPWLLDAFEALAARRPGALLHVAGGGAGAEAETLRARMERAGPRVVLHGRLGQPELAELMRTAALFVLPSLFEGLPLVLVEAVACGCRAVATRLPGLEAELAPRLGSALALVEPPRLERPDEPRAEDLPRFVAELEAAIDRMLDEPESAVGSEALAPFTWASVFRRVERVWLELVEHRARA